MVANDIEVVNGGSVVLLVPITDNGRRWCDEYLSDAMRFGMGVAVESRYVAPIIEGMQGDGLVVA